MASQLKSRYENNLLTDPIIDSMSDSPHWINRVMVIWLAGIFIFLPVKIFDLPFNFELGDIWIFAGIPVILILLCIVRFPKISLSYTIPMWFVLIGSLISSVASRFPRNAIIVIGKEVYLFVLYGVVAVLLSHLSAKEMQRILRVWSLVVICHGLLMIIQFFSPAVWQFTNALSGNSTYLENYRSAGLFICDAAGCANKAAFYQIMGFVPLLLADFSKRTTVIGGLFLFISILSSGSMGATLAFSSGLIVTIFVSAYIKKNLSILIKNVFLIFVALSFLGGALFIVGNQNQSFTSHLERIIFGRFDKSSTGRFNLWGRGIDVLLGKNTVFVGIGPENFREIDGGGNQLHNDILAFLVERGLIGLTGLALFAGFMLNKSIHLLQIFRREPERYGIGLVVFLAVFVVTIIESLFHQVFHARELWLVLAVQEAVLIKMRTSESGIGPIVRIMKEAPQYLSELLVQPEITDHG